MEPHDQHLNNKLLWVEWDSERNESIRSKIFRQIIFDYVVYI